MISMIQDWKKLYYNGKIINDLNGFRGEYEIFSNFSKHENISIVLPYKSKNGIKYSANNIETLFQAAKMQEVYQIEEIVKSNDPKIAKYLGRRYKMRKDWEEIKEQVMKELLEKKFNVSNKFRTKLLSIPNDMFIVEMNNFCDKEWGVCSKTFLGKNKLGKLLMELKQEKKGKKNVDNR